MNYLSTNGKQRNQWTLLALLAVSFCSTAFGDAMEAMVRTPTMQRVLAGVDGRLKTSTIENRLTGKVLRTSGPEFVITYADGQMVTSDAFNLLALEGTDACAVARLHNTELSLTAEISYTSSEKRWAYKQIRFTNTGNKPFLLRTVELEHLKVAKEKVTYAVDPSFPLLSDWGQPVYTESLWFGLEFPASRNSATKDGFVFLRHHPGIEIAPGESYQTKRAVLGAAEPGEVKQAFMDYVATLPPRQEAPQLNHYLRTYLLMVPRDNYKEGVVEPTRIENLQNTFEGMRKIKELTGYSYMSITTDVPFYRTEGHFVPVESDTWQEIRDAVEPLGTKLGFWMSFSCIYTASTHDWGKTQGHELQHERSYCLAGPNYYAAIKKRMEDIVRDYDMGSITMDGMYWGQGAGCNEPGHGHLVAEGEEQGLYGTERVVENMLAILESLREIQSDILVGFDVCSEWASPWWLTQVDGVHTVVGDTVAAGIASPWVRDELITVRDIQVFEEHRRVKRQFPLWAEDLYGTQMRGSTLIDNVLMFGEAYHERWEDEFVMSVAGRGAITVNNVIWDLDTIERSPGGLRFAGELPKWTEANEAIYRDFHLFGGEPKDLEIYGYSHCDGKGRAIVALRNPYIVADDFPLVLDESLGLKPTDEKLCVNIIYPYRKTFEKVGFGETVDISLQDYQTLMLEILTESRQFDQVPSAGRWSVEESGKLVLYDESILEETPAGKLKLKSKEEALHLVGKVTVPSTATGGQIQLMLDSIVGHPVTKPLILVNGQEADYEFHERRGEIIKQNWALINLPPGEHQVDIELVCSSPENKAQIGAWLVANYKLAGQLTDRRVPQAAQLFPVFAADEDRRMTTLFTPVERQLPFRLDPISDDSSMFMSDLRGRCLETKIKDGTNFGWGHSAELWYSSDLRIGTDGKNTYKKGIGFWAPGHATFDIDGKYKRFVAEIGLLGVPASVRHYSSLGAEAAASVATYDWRTILGSCEFIVEGDGQELYRSPVLKEGDPPHPISVDVSGVKTLTLRANNGGDGVYFDITTWGDARVER